jgi:hypothetical protein
MPDHTSADPAEKSLLLEILAQKAASQFLVVEEQLEILRRIGERGRSWALQKEDEMDRNHGVDLWQHLLDELDRLKLYLNGQNNRLLRSDPEESPEGGLGSSSRD